MCTSVVVDFEDIYARSPELAKALIESPTAILAQAGVIAKEQLRIEEPEYAEKVREVTVRINRLPDLLPLRKLSSTYIGKLVSIEGIVVRATPVRPLVVNAVFKCLRCDQPILTGLRKPVPTPPQPRTCPYCKSKGPFELDEEKTEFVDYQEVRVQEKPEDLPPGQLPRWVNVRIIGSDLVDVARPGDRVVVTGIVRVASSSARKGLEMYIEANNIEVATREAEAVEISPEEEEEIRKLAKDPNIHEKIIRSIAPSIYGYEHIKEAIMYLLFGGVTKELPDVRKRGDIHVLLIGDPGTGKSALLQYVARIAPRGLYTSGRGSTAAGLCVSGDTLIYTEKGPVRIADLVEYELSRGELKLSDGVWVSVRPNPVKVCAFGQSGVAVREAMSFYRLKARELIAIRTRMGKELVTTPETQVLCYNGRGLKWRRACEVKPGDYLVHVTELPNLGGEPPLMIDYVGDDVFCDCELRFLRRLIARLRERYGTLRRAANVLGLDENKLYHWWPKGKLKPRVGQLKKICSLLGVSMRELAENVRAFYYKSYRGREIVKLPVCVNEKFMEFLGHIYANGEITQDKRKKCFTIGYFKGDIRYVEKFKELVKGLFGLDVKVRKDPREECYFVKFSNRLIAELLMRFGVPVGRKHGKLEIPEEIARLPNRLVAAFLRQLFTDDGGISGGKCVSFSTANRTLAEQVRMLLLRFGIMSTLTVRPPKEAKVRKTGCVIRSGSRYEVCIYDRESLAKFRDLIGFSDEERQEKLEAMIARKKGHRNYKVRGKLSFLKVTGVEKLEGDFTVYDLTVEGAHCFIANGFVVHNTAAVVKEAGGGMSLEAGALVLADKGVAAIDEIEKMRPEDRVAIHEALEQQTISIAKGGIVATLNARTAVLAAANPALGRYDPYRSVVENISLPITILSRFDLIFVIRDVPEKERDARMAEHILETHRAREASVEPPIPPELLRKYISYAKMIEPKLTDEAIERIREFYLQMRSKSEEEGAPIAITARQLESLIRIAEARARAALREYVTAEDAEAAINIMKRSLQEVGIDLETKKLDIDVIMTGKPKSLRDKLQLVVDAIGRLDEGDGVSEEDLIRELEPEGISEPDIRRLLGILLRDGMIFEVRPGRFRKV